MRIEIRYPATADANLGILPISTSDKLRIMLTIARILRGEKLEPKLQIDFTD
jgi:hypothetical protein